MDKEKDINNATGAVAKEKSKINFDKLLVEEIGQCGKFQMKIMAQCMVAVLFFAFNNNEFLFTAARIETRCFIPECETEPAQFSPEWISAAIPAAAGALDNCQRFANASAPLGAANDTCPATLFDNSVTTRCEEYVYENTNTIVYDFGLACEEWRRAMVGSVRTLGMMVALPLTGFVSDRWGRRRALAISASCAPVFGVLRYWAPNYTVYVVLMFVESGLGMGAFSSANVLFLELLGPQYRVIGAATISATSSVGKIILAMSAWAVQNWRTLLLVLYIPQFVSFLYFWTLAESVRWLMSKGKFKELEVLLIKAAGDNGKKLTQKSLDDIRVIAENRLDKCDDPPLTQLVLKYKKLLGRCLVTSTLWASSTFLYYGLTINSVNLLDNMYLGYIAVVAIEIPGFYATLLFIDRFGRKPVIIAMFWLCALCQLGFVYIANGVGSLIIYCLGKWCISVIMAANNVFTLELYPTECRHRFFAFSSMLGRLGSIVAPLTPALGVSVFPSLPYIMFGGVAVMAGAVTLLLPETRGVPLPDTISEAFVKHKTAVAPKKT